MVRGRTLPLDSLLSAHYFSIQLINHLENYRMGDDELSTTFAALADPTRRAILARLAGGEATVNELAEPFDLSLPAVSKHLKVLQKAGLVTQGRKAQWRPCRLEPARLKEAHDWVEQYRGAWEERFDRLGEYLRELQKEEKRDGGND
jgi:DNA-binding transcriptional ArsR family regulator